MGERKKDEKVKKERDRIGECRSEEENEGEEGRDGDRQIDGGGGGSSDRVWVLRRSGAMCSVSSSDLSFLDPPPSRYSGGSLGRGRRVKERKIEREREGVHVHTPRVPTRPYTCTFFLATYRISKEEPEGKTDKRERKGRL